MLTSGGIEVQLLKPGTGWQHSLLTEGQALLIHGHARYVPWLGPAPPDAVVGLR